MNDDITQIKERNKRVELDKAWELSLTRRLLITILIYFVVVVFLIMIQVPHPWISAIVPAIGYFLSTLSLKFVKKIWMLKH